MRLEIAECLNLRTDLSKKVLVEELIKFLNHQNEQRIVAKEVDLALSNKHESKDFPLQDTFWYIKKVNLEQKDFISHRLLVLVDAGTSPTVTVQFSLIEKASVSFEDQAFQLFFHGCFFPLDGRRSRRPRFLSLKGKKFSKVQQECISLGIHFCGDFPTRQEVDSLREGCQNGPSFRQCSVCALSATSEFFYSCKRCKAVLYCQERCESEDWEDSHHEWCSQFKQCMLRERELADLPFKFASETTRIEFDDKKRQEFFKVRGVYGKGLWRQECLPYCPTSSSDEDAEQSKIKTDKEIDWHSVFVLEQESTLLQQAPPLVYKPISGWEEYYSFRGFDLTSPIAVLLHFPLTLYYIISHLLPKDYYSCFCQIQESRKICIHLIGVEKEVELFYPFLECARLLPHLSLQIHLFGNNFEDIYHRQKMEKENLHFEFHKGLYHDLRQFFQDIPESNLTVCFNGGIGAYASFIQTVHLVTSKRTPFYYTDYGQECVAFSRDKVKKSRVGHVSPSLLNPFRSPLRMVSLDQNLPRYSNAFITNVIVFA